MHLTRREVCASASHRPLTDRHGRPSSVWARSQQPTVPAPRRHRGGALCRRPEAGAAAFHRLRVLGSSRILRNSGPRSLVAWSGSSPGGGAKAVGSATLGQATGPRRPDRRGRSSRAPGGSPAPARGCLEQPWSGEWVAWAGCCACGVTCDAVDRGGVHDREVGLLVARAELAEEVEGLVDDRGRVGVRLVDLVDHHQDAVAHGDRLLQHEARLPACPKRREIGEAGGLRSTAAASLPIATQALHGQLRWRCTGLSGQPAAQWAARGPVERWEAACAAAS